MRMWMVDPRLMCRKHLLGEHLELHYVAGFLRNKRDLSGWLRKGQIAPEAVARRHKELVAEMLRRGYRHTSPLKVPRTVLKGCVDAVANLRELHNRCSECREMRRLPRS